jgi:hypothetical protein
MDDIDAGAGPPTSRVRPHRYDVSLVASLSDPR